MNRPATTGARAHHTRVSRGRSGRGRSLAMLLCGLLVLLLATNASALVFAAARARIKIFALQLDEAAKILESAGEDVDVLIERARLAVYRGDCDGALAILERPDLVERDESAMLLAVSKGCARGTAATIIERDDKLGVVVRFQDDADRPLFPFIAKAAAQIRDALARDLGTRLPEPLFVDLVRDQLTLSALSGLPEQAAQTTGTVAVAKFGRVMIISPRAARHGYRWLDTLAHEITHLVLSQATRERAPLWLHEGVAKRQEVRWRTSTPFDAIPAADDVAAYGIARGLDLPLTGLGPSIAMLPSPQQAMIAFAEVSSFIDFWVARAGDRALPKLLEAIRDAPPGGDAGEAISTVSGVTLGDWEKRWRAWLASQPHKPPPELSPARGHGAAREVARRSRLGELLLLRGHHRQAAIELERAHTLLPSDATVRCNYVDAHTGLGQHFEAARLVAQPKHIRLPIGRWWSLHAAFEGTAALPNAWQESIAHDPLNPAVACRELPVGELPTNPIQRALCEAARREPWE